MSKEPNLKANNTPILWVFFSFNVALLTSFFFANYVDLALSDIKSLLTVRASSVLVAPLILFVVNGLLSSDLKATLVFWRIKDVLPGCRAFSSLGKKDYRVDMARLVALHGTLPTTPKEQNSRWYKLYKLNKDDQGVQTSHRKFLLARDLVAISFLFLILAGIPFLFLGDKPFNYCYSILLLLIYLILVVVARNHGNRFVTNVLAVESVK